LLRVGRDGAAAVNVGHRLRVRGETVDCAKSPGLQRWEGLLSLVGIANDAGEGT
jgi:hypothetical protein